MATSAVVAVAAPALVGPVDGPATAGARATAVEVLGDIVTVSDVGELDTANLYGALAAARDAGAVNVWFMSGPSVIVRLLEQSRRR